ncbi:MAG: hypothetical protein D6806_14505 [Deltaproteobacteria bacterium]|nr:MAG: hypothetical protein D6806_14505 [Deltaproteobacteria bacterium]
MRGATAGLRVWTAVYWLIVCLMMAAASWLIGDRILFQAMLVNKRSEVRRSLERTWALSGTGDRGRWMRKALEWIPGAEGIALVDEGGRVLESAGSGARGAVNWAEFAPTRPRLWREADGSLKTLVTVGLDGGRRLEATVDLSGLQGLAKGYSRNLLWLLLLVSIVAAALGIAASNRLLLRPLGRLIGYLDTLPESGFDFLSGRNAGLLGSIGLALRRMARRIEEDRQELRRQVEDLSRLNRQLRQMQQSLLRSEKLASVGRLAAGVAHEVGNPISAVLGYLGMIRDPGTPPEEREEMLDRVEREVERIDEVIRDLLSYSRPSHGEPMACGPLAVCEEALALIKPQGKFKSIEFEMDVPPDLPSVMADPQLARQVLVNLMLNALDALPPGGHLWLRAAAVYRDERNELVWQAGGEPLPAGREPGWFGMGRLHRIELSQQGSWLAPGRGVVVFCVVDDGPGIEPEVLSSIFDPFFTTKDPGKGTGLGLSICHSAVTAMGGEIWVWSELGEGTQFAFTLPVCDERSDQTPSRGGQPREGRTPF